MDNPWGSPWANPASRTPSPSRASVFFATNITSGNNVSQPSSLFPKTQILDLNETSLWSADDDDGFGDWANPSSQNNSLDTSFTTLQGENDCNGRQPHEIRPDKQTSAISAAPLLQQENGMSVSTNTSNNTATVEITVDPWATAEDASSFDDCDDNPPRLSEDKSSLASIRDEAIESPITPIDPSSLHIQTVFEPTPESPHQVNLESDKQIISQPPLDGSVNAEAELATSPGRLLSPLESPSAQRTPKLPQDPSGDEQLQPRKTRQSSTASPASASRVQSLVDLYDGITRKVSQAQLSPVSHTGQSPVENVPSRAGKPSTEDTIDLQQAKDKAGQERGKEATAQEQASVLPSGAAEALPTTNSTSDIDSQSEPDKDVPVSIDRAQEPLDATVVLEAESEKQSSISSECSSQGPALSNTPHEPESFDAQPAGPCSRNPIPWLKVHKDVDMDLVDKLYAGLGDPAATTREVLPQTIYDSFVTTSERRTWLRVSRHGSTRRHNLADDANYRPVRWTESIVQKDTVNIVRRWMEEGSTVGRVMSSIGGAQVFAPKASTKMFSWNDTSASDPVDMSALNERLELKKSEKECRLPRPISVPGFRGFHVSASSVSSVASIGSPTTPIKEKGDAIVFSITPPPTRRALPQESSSSPAATREDVKMTPKRLSNVVSQTEPPSPNVGTTTRASTEIEPETPTEHNAEAAGGDNDDDDEWGEMVDSSTSFAAGQDDESSEIISTSFHVPLPITIPTTLATMPTPSHSVYASGASSPVSSIATLSPIFTCPISPRSRQQSMSGSIPPYGTIRPYTPSPLSATSMMDLSDLSDDVGKPRKSGYHLGDSPLFPSHTLPIGPALSVVSPVSPSPSLPTVSSSLRHSLAMGSPVVTPPGRDDTPKPVSPSGPTLLAPALDAEHAPGLLSQSTEKPTGAPPDDHSLSTEEKADIERLLGELPNLAYMLQ
ncbi:hypothetical protein CFIMG_008358RA00001 [Ceratocystis fimbriata CBS 114723]|uniref:Glucan 1, 4-alpha-glucosidase n=1 Tax=Ceratocystis fimbriata CBS 114723 TaxID=1035309 RepID=A0A2C5X2L0_9PEZI|nr:hypothetical protein CFIMG_008358RA00001 [Ceratocystis fimbriata CBS 114723]